MFNRSLLISLVAFIAASPCLAQQVQPPTPALVFIRVGVTVPTTLMRKEVTQGSGFLIDDAGHIITARHVIWGREAEEPGPRWVSVSLRGKHNSPAPGQIVACESPPIDLCLIKIQSDAVTAVNITAFFVPLCRKLNRGDRISAFGYPTGLDGWINPVGRINGDMQTELKYPSDVPIQPGMSGGPVLDEGGHVVAVNAGAAPNITLTFLQPLIYGISLFKRAGIDCEPAVTIPAAVTGPRKCPEELTGAQSPNTVTPPTDLIVTNKGGAQVRMYWLNQSGQRILYYSIASKASQHQPTYLGHPWVITDLSDNCLQFIMPQASQREVEVR